MRDSLVSTLKELAGGSNINPNDLSYDFREMIKIAFDCPEKPIDLSLSIFDSQTHLHVYDACFLLTGGSDSTIQFLLNSMRSNFCCGLYVDFGQPYAKRERTAVESITKNRQVPIYYMDVDAHNWTYWDHIVPGRNILLLTLAADRLRDHGTIYFGVTSGEGYSSGKGDKSSAFIEAWREWYLGLTGKNIYVKTMASKTKGEWLSTFVNDGYDVNTIRHTCITCFNPQEDQPCGSCQACLRKFLSFAHIFVDTSKDYFVHPMIGAKKFVDKYKRVLNEAIESANYDHYSYARCVEDLEAIETATNWLSDASDLL